MRLPIRVLLSILVSIAVKCNEIEKYSGFNENLRAYSEKDKTNATSDVKTLQNEQLARYAYFVPTNPTKIKDIADNALAGSSDVKGYSPQSKIGYGSHDYDEPGHDHGHEIGHYGYGPTDYFIPNAHELGHHDPGIGYGYGHGHNHLDGHGYHHHHKHYDHALATKAILWPIAGLALLGAAAALVSNPVLLQLGVVSGKRRRRDTEEVTGPEIENDFLKTLKNNDSNHVKEAERNKFIAATDRNKKRFKRRSMRKKLEPQNIFGNNLDSNDEGDGLIPIPLKIRN